MREVPRKRSEIETVCLQQDPNEPASYVMMRVKLKRDGAVETESEIGRLSIMVRPKPCDLPSRQVEGAVAAGG